MDPERWKKITEIFHAALARESGQRAAFVAGACGDDRALRAEVDALLTGDAKARAGGDPFQAPAAAVASGTTLGPYRIESAIGAGGMGEVYRARDTRLNRSVAIKVLPADVRERARTRASASSARRRPSPRSGIRTSARLYDVGQHDGVDFLVMEHLEGETLWSSGCTRARCPGSSAAARDRDRRRARQRASRRHRRIAT